MILNVTIFIDEEKQEILISKVSHGVLSRDLIAFDTLVLNAPVYGENRRIDTYTSGKKSPKTDYVQKGYEPSDEGEFI